MFLGKMMDADIISYESMFVAQEAAKWTFWSMLGVWFSSVVTLCAVCVAKKALTTWKEQHIATLKGYLIASLANYLGTLSCLPEIIEPSSDTYRRNIENITRSFNDIIREWWALRFALNDYRKNNEAEILYWTEDLLLLIDLHNDYISGGCKSVDVKKAVIKYTKDRSLSVSL